MTIIHSLSNSPTYNLAFEEYLFSEFQTDFLLFYVNEPSVIIGSNQAVCNEVNTQFCTENNIKIIRRKSGGGAVFHDLGNLNFSFIGNKSPEKNALSDSFLQPIVATLATFGVETEIGKRKDLWLNNGSKISGTASQIRKNRELHHGTLLINTNLEMLEKALMVTNNDKTIKATASVRSRTKNIIAYLCQNKGIEYENIQFIQQFISSSATLLGESLCFNTDYKTDAIAFYENTYLSDDWNFRK